MGYAQAVRARKPGDEDDYLEDYWRDGYAVIRGLFSPREIEQMATASDQLYAEGLRHGRSFRHGNLFYNVAEGTAGEPLVRMVQWPSYHQTLLNAVRLDARIARLLEPLLGPDLKQIINQVHWKAPGSVGEFAWHQDSRSRRPPSAYRNLATSYVQTGIAIDPHGPDCGGMKFIPRSQVQGDLGMNCSRKALGEAPTEEALAEVGLSKRDAVDLVMEPGDFAMWSPYLVHSSGLNGSDHGAASTSTAMSAPPTATAANGLSEAGAPCRLARSRLSCITTSSMSDRSRTTSIDRR
jgi:ectoine hydroxylase-related dioxygenase (phytanoyl-CoA dioxygenase family)